MPPDSLIRSPPALSPHKQAQLSAHMSGDRVVTVFPEFIARDGGERADGCRPGNQRRVTSADRHRRGHARRALTAHDRGLQSRTR